MKKIDEIREAMNKAGLNSWLPPTPELLQKLFPDDPDYDPDYQEAMKELDDFLDSC